MRILVISDLPQFVTGGAEMQAARLIEAWLSAGHQVTCFGRRMGCGPVKIGGHAVLVRRIRTTSIFGRWSRAVSYFISLSWLILRNRNEIDIVYTRFLGEAAMTIAMLKRAKVFHAPLVATPANVHGNGDAHFLRSIPSSDRLVRLLDKECDAINLIADDMAGELRAMGFSGRNFSHIPNGIRLSLSHHRKTTCPPKFLAIGRLAPQKGYDVLLRALVLLRTHLQPNQIKIAGDGPERERLTMMTKDLQLEDYVEWLGELTQAQVREQLERADIFLLPSLYEGLSNAGLEALERGLPIILTQCGGLDLYIDSDTGWVVPPSDPAGLAEAILSALDLPANRLAAMGVCARKCVERNFDIAVTAHLYVELFKSFRKTQSEAESGHP